MKKILIVILCFVLLAFKLWAGQKLMYAIRHENLQGLPGIIKLLPGDIGSLEN